MSELHGLWTTISIKLFKKNNDTENSLAVQQLGLCTFCAEGMGSIPGGKLRSQAVQCGQKKGKENNNNNNKKVHQHRCNMLNALMCSCRNKGNLNFVI